MKFPILIATYFLLMLLKHILLPSQYMYQHPCMIKITISIQMQVNPKDLRSNGGRINTCLKKLKYQFSLKITALNQLKKYL